MSTELRPDHRWSLSTGDPTPALTIRVSSGVGSGTTHLSAFDQALAAAGVGDFNLVRLSSIIPPGSVVVETEPSAQIHGGFGDLLYTVYAESHASVPGHTACAGVIWASALDDSGSGLFAEGDGSSREEVEAELQQTMAGMIHHRHGRFEVAGLITRDVACTAETVSAVVIASYRCLPWQEGRLP